MLNKDKWYDETFGTPKTGTQITIKNVVLEAIDRWEAYKANYSNETAKFYSGK